MFESYDKKLVVFMFYGRFYELLLTFLGSKAILMARKTRYMFESYDQKIRFWLFYGRFSWAIVHGFGFHGGFVWPVRPNTCLRIMTKNSLFWCFLAVFMSYCPRFWDSMGICMSRKTQTFPRFWGSRGICMAYKNRFIFERYNQKFVIFVFYGRFHELLPMVLRFQGTLHGP